MIESIITALRYCLFGYLAIGLATAAVFVMIIGPTALRDFIGIVIFWPAFWAMALIFAAAAFANGA